LLVVDDEARTAEVTAELLRRAGAAVEQHERVRAADLLQRARSV